MEYLLLSLLMVLPFMRWARAQPIDYQSPRRRLPYPGATVEKLEGRYLF